MKNSLVLKVKSLRANLRTFDLLERTRFKREIEQTSTTYANNQNNSDIGDQFNKSFINCGPLLAKLIATKSYAVYQVIFNQ